MNNILLVSDSGSVCEILDAIQDECSSDISRVSYARFRTWIFDHTADFYLLDGKQDFSEALLRISLARRRSGVNSGAAALYDAPHRGLSSYEDCCLSGSVYYTHFEGDPYVTLARRISYLEQGRGYPFMDMDLSSLIEDVLASYGIQKDNSGYRYIYLILFRTFDQRGELVGSAKSWIHELVEIQMIDDEYNSYQRMALTLRNLPASLFSSKNHGPSERLREIYWTLNKKFRSLTEY